MNENEISAIVARIVGKAALTVQGKAIPVEVSARHVHLSEKDVQKLFGIGHALTPKRDLTQPGQFLSEERVTIVTAKGEFRNVAVLGPARTETQVELSMTDAKALGVAAPIRQSGDVAGAGCVYLVSEHGMIAANHAAIVAQNHIHMTPNDAAAYDVMDGEIVKVQMQTARSLTFDDVVVRVNDHFSLALHLDFDEANACAFQKGDQALLFKSGAIPMSTKSLVQPVRVVQSPGMLCCKQTPLLITEEVAKTMIADGQKTVMLTRKTILTPMANDVFSAARVKIEKT